MTTFYCLRFETLTNLRAGTHIYTSRNRMDRAGHAAKIGAKKNAYRILVGTSGQKPLERPRLKWVDNIKMDLREIRWDDIDLIYLAHDRDKWKDFVNTVMNLQFYKMLNS
jgi:hypothetical protein